jgi:hypothetical protein
MKSIDRQTPDSLARVLMNEEKNVHLARARLRTLRSFLDEAEANLPNE